MNINDISSKIAVEHLGGKPKAASSKPAPPPSSGVSDSFKPEYIQRYTELLENEPDIRPEVLDRAKELVNDPDYPNEAILSKLAQEFIPRSPR